MYGPAAQLSLGLNRPRGVIATISLPYAIAVPAVCRTMTSAETLQQRSTAAAHDLAHGPRAWCGITRGEVITSFLFGVCYFLYEAIAYMPVVLSSEDLRWHFATLSAS